MGDVLRRLLGYLILWGTILVVAGVLVGGCVVIIGDLADNPAEKREREQQEQLDCDRISGDTPDVVLDACADGAGERDADNVP